MSEKCVVRKTLQSEYAFTENLTREAFWNVYRPGCNEHLVLHNFRQSSDFVPELDCVLEVEGEIVAHIMYCRATVKADEVEQEFLMFGPISVEPKLQRRGYGSKIITETLEMAKGLGYPAVIITGSPKYYHRFGFESCSKYNIFYDGKSHDDEAAFFMIKLLNSDFSSDKEFIFQEPACYSPDEAQLEEFEKNFPPKIKEKRSK